jgi:putative aldouronate transport system substrate-binding protein
MANEISRRRLVGAVGSVALGASAASLFRGTTVAAPRTVPPAQATPETALSFEGTGGLTLPFSPQPLPLRGFSTALYAPAPGVKSLSDQLFFKEAAKRTNVSFDWQMAAADATNPVDLVMASGDLPDTFWGITPTQAVDYGQQGALAPLNDLIANYCPNFTSLMNQNPDLRPQITAPDGNIYFFPRVLLEPETRNFSGFIIRQDWLDEVGMTTPETTDDLYAVLTAFKQKDAKRYPLTWDARPLMWAFGSGGRGAAQATDFSHEGNEIRYAALEPGFADGLAYLNKLYAEGLLDPEWTNSLTGDGQPDFFKERWLNGVSGVQFGYAGTHLSGYANALKAAGSPAKLAPFLPPAGPTGVRENLSNHTIIDPGQGGAIAASSKHAQEVAQFVDYIYSPEGVLLFFWGVEGDTFTFDVGGVPQYTSKVTNNDAKLSVGEYVWNYISPDWFGPMLYPKLAYFASIDPVAQQGLELWATLESKRQLPVLLFTKDEAATIRTTMTDINTLMDEKETGFISGSEPLAGVADLANTINGMGIDNAIKAYQEAYDRFTAS